MNMKDICIIIALAILCLVCFTCGLERPLIAFSPPVYSETSNYRFIFQSQSDHDDTADAVFLGYEVYYKFALDPVEFTAVNNLTDAAQLNSAGFRRIYDAVETWEPASSVDLPLFKTNDAAEGNIYTITVDFTDILNPVIGDEGGYGLSHAIRRNLQDSLEPDYGEYRKFSEFWNGDADINNSIFDGLTIDNKGEEITTPVYIAIYVFAYGKSLGSQSFLADIRSPLLYMSYNTITIIYDDGI
ncbi:MAG: hypothetical protein JW904_15595 [Spirochaetales bacterium]|nr:hypothetical protein [Spirochaetales bacterium]